MSFFLPACVVAAGLVVAWSRGGFPQPELRSVQQALVDLPAEGGALLVHGLFRSEIRLDDKASSTLHDRRQALGRLRGGEAGVLVIFGLTALAWLFRQPKLIGTLEVPGLEGLWPGLTDASIGLAGALLAFNDTFVSPRSCPTIPSRT